MSTKLANMIPVAKAAEILGCTPRRVQQLLKDGSIAGEPISKHFWLVDLPSLRRYAKKPQTMGRPRISEQAKES